MAVQTYILLPSFDTEAQFHAWCDRHQVDEAFAYRGPDGMFRGSARLPADVIAKAEAVR